MKISKEKLVSLWISSSILSECDIQTECQVRIERIHRDVLYAHVEKRLERVESDKEIQSLRVDIKGRTV